MKVEYVDGREFTRDSLRNYLSGRNEPVVVTNAFPAGWSPAEWNLSTFETRFADVASQIKLFQRGDDASSTVAMETDCCYVTSTFGELCAWMRNDEEKEQGKLGDYPVTEYWGYSSYNYLTSLLEPGVLDWTWGCLGHPEYTGYHTTLWVGSRGAYTPCHKDTYSTNLVVQIDGVKRWKLFPPDDERIQPTRIPYEESSVFTTMQTKHLVSLQVDLKAGEALYVPKQWWHYVECLSDSVSINLWIQQESDKFERVKEAIVKCLVYAFKSCDETPQSNWLNPGEVAAESMTECVQLLKNSLTEVNGNDRQLSSDTLLNHLCSEPHLKNLAQTLVDK